MKKIILSAVLAAALTLSSLSTASAMSMEVYGDVKMNIWDFYLTENNPEKPDVLTGATVDAVSQATYNMYDNLPVDITAAMDFNLLADCVIMDAQGLKNTSITKILQTWQEGYKTTLLGNSKSDITYPIGKSLVKATLNDGQILYVPYSAVAVAAADSPEFSWNAFLKQAAETAPSVPPYRVKYILETGEFGKGFLVSDAAAKEAPQLTLDENYNNDKANRNVSVKINFEGNTHWANAVYAITINGSGLISGETGDHASSTVINGETNFLKGSNPKNTSDFIIRLSQKFRIGDNAITVMAHGYKDAVLNIPVTEMSDWMVNVTAKNLDNDALLTENSNVAQGAVILVESRMKKDSNNPGEFSALWMDGRLIPKVGGKDDNTKYTQNGKTLSYYTDDLAAGSHELRLKRLGHPDSVFQFTITHGEKNPAPVFALNREQLQDGSEIYQGGVVKGNNIILRSEIEVSSWFANIQKVFWIDSTGSQRDITTDYNRTIEDENKTVTIINKTFNYLNTEGKYTLLFKSRGYEDVSMPLQIVRAMPSSNALTYEADGSVVLRSSDSTYLSKSRIKTVTINGTAYPSSAFTMTTSSPYTMTIPSEYFQGGMKAVVQISAEGYSDFIRTLQIPAEHKKRVYAPEAQLEQSRVPSGDNIVLNFTDDSSWRGSITSAVYRPEGSSTDSKLTPDTSTPGKLTMKAPSYTTGKGTLIIKATGYRDLTLPIELITGVPGTVTSELQSDGSLSVAISNSAYLNKLSVEVDGNLITVIKSSGKLTIPADAFPSKKAYEVILKAEGYADYRVSVNTDVKAAPVVTAPVKPFEKQAFTITSGNSDWAGKITGATLYSGSSTYATYTRSGDISVEGGNVTFAGKSMASYGSYTLKIQAEGYLSTSVEVTFVKAVPQDISFEAADNGVLLNVSDYSYRTAIQTIKIGEAVLSKNTDFSTGTSPIVLDKSRFPQEQATVAIFATGYADYTTTFNLSAVKPAPQVSLPGEVALTSDLVLTSEDRDWAKAVTKIEIGKSSFSSADKAQFTVADGTITLPASKFKALTSVYTGTGYTIKVYADGYYTKQFTNVTIYAKNTSAFSQHAAWDGFNLQIDLSEGASSYYDVSKVFVDGAQVTPLSIPGYSSKLLVIPEGTYFTGKAGETVTVKITGSSYSYLPDLILQVKVPVE